MANILVVDDSIVMRKMIRSILEKYGHTVVGEAEDGLDAVKKYVFYKPDITTVDITMPQMNGIEAVREIRKINAEALIVVVSAMGQKHMVADAVKAGAKDFIVKPFEEAKLLQSVNNLATLL